MHITAFILCHKLERFVDRAVGSVMAQTRLPDDIILVGTDCRHETYAALEFWQSHRLRPRILLSNDKLTCAQSKNFCASWGKGSHNIALNTEAFFILDADDWLMPKYVERVAGYMEQSNAAVVGCDYIVVDEHGIIGPANANTLSVEDLHIGNPLPAVSLVRRTAFEAMGGYRENLIYEDWEMWVRMSKAGHRLFRYPQILYNYSRHATNLTNTVSNERGIEEIKCLLSATTTPQSLPK